MKIQLKSTIYVMSVLVLTVLIAACGDQGSNATTAVTAAITTNTDIETGPKYSFAANGELNQPVDYRRWVYVGTPLTPNDMNEPEAAFPEFHNVYIHPEDFEYYEKNGKWQDGTILVKELVSVGKKVHVSGKGYFQGEFQGLEVTIKDSKKFADEPGNWAYFSFGHSYPLAKTASAFPTAACNTCHANSAADDFVFTQDYPVLRAAKNSKNKSIGLLENKSIELQSEELLSPSTKTELASYIAQN